MAQTMILPGTYIEVRDEGLITAGAVATGNIGIVGTASKGPVNEVQLLGSLSEAKEIFGDKDEIKGSGNKELTLIRALEFIYQNGGKTIYAVRTGKDVSNASYTLTQGTTELLKLEAKTPGSWGNKIAIEITTLEESGEPKVATKQEVKLLYGGVEEKYQVASVADLETQINTKSVLVAATDLNQTNKDKLPHEIPSNAEKPTYLSPGDNGKADYETSLAMLENEIINIVLLGGQDNTMASVLEGHLKMTAEIKRERIGIIGSSKDTLDDIANHTLNNDRLIFTAPGILSTSNNKQYKLPGVYMAAAVAGLIASLPPKTSPTNKTLVIEGLSKEFNSSQLEKLVSSRVLVVEKRNGFRIVKGITTNDGAWKQITTRRIVDYAIYGVRSSCNPYIGKLNNERVRGAMKATLDSFLTGMVDSEALVGYTLNVSATRAQEIAGKVMVKMTLQPTFSIDFIQVTMYLG